MVSSRNNQNSNDERQELEAVRDRNRRTLWTKKLIQVASEGLATTAVVAWTRPVWATSKSRSRTDGYDVQKTEAEWQDMLSPMQYRILRQGGTEKPYFSILEGETRPGIYSCAGCGTPLFDAADKFKSGTGWPSFARGLEGVEIETFDDPVTRGLLAANLVGAELRCQTCGGHLGDVFNDGWLFVGTPAAETGKRYCIDGAALVFQPSRGKKDILAAVRGDISAASITAASQPEDVALPSWLEPPKIDSKSR